MAGPPPSTRKKARQLLVQALYQWQLGGAEIHQIEAQFRTEHSTTGVDVDFFSEVLHGIPRQLTEVDAAFSRVIDRNAGTLDPVSLAVLRLGTYELLYRLDVPFRVVINEAINLAKLFGPTDAHKYVNGVLDKVAAAARGVELRASRARH